MKRDQYGLDDTCPEWNNFYDTSMSKPKKAAFILKAAYRDLKSMCVETAWALLPTV